MSEDTDALSDLFFVLEATSIVDKDLVSAASTELTKMRVELSELTSEAAELRTQLEEVPSDSVERRDVEDALAQAWARRNPGTAGGSWKFSKEEPWATLEELLR